jgi:hypothetical protein
LIPATGVTIGPARSTSYKLDVLDNRTGLTDTNRVIYGTNTNSEYNTTTRVIRATALYGLANGTRTSGSNDLINIGVYGKAENGQVNWAGYFDGNAFVNGDVTVTDEAYDATGWNGSLEVPTKNAVRDKLETLVSSINSQTGAVTVTAGDAIAVVTNSQDVNIAVNYTSSLLPHTITTFFTDVSNIGTGESDIYSHTTATNTLSSNGQTLYFDYTINVTDVTSTVTLAVYFGGTSIGNTGALAVSATGTWRVTGSITRATSTTARATVVVDRPGTDSDYINETDLTSQDFTTTNIVKVTGTAGGAGGGTGDITGKMGKLYYQP